MRWPAAILGWAVVGGCASSSPVDPVRPAPLSFAIDLAATPPAAETYEDDDLAHLRYLLTDGEILRWGALTPEERAVWFRSVWGRVDASPTTPENERKREHFRRLAHVRAHFAIEEEPGWDRRGELLLRYGSPQSRVVTSPDVRPVFGLLPARELWLYAWLDQAFLLEDPMLQGNFQESWGGTRRTSRPDLAYGNQPIDLGSTRSLESGGMSLEQRRADEELRRMLGRGSEAAAGALPHAFYLDPGGERLDFVFDVVSFGGTAGRSRVEIHSAFSAGDLEYVDSDEGRAATIDVVVVAKTTDYEEVARAAHVRSDRGGDAEAERTVLEQLALELEPGPYRLAVEARDRASGDVGIYLTETVVRDFSLPTLAISDIQLALDVKRGQPGDAFLKGPYQVVPYPLGTFPRDRDIYLFFEVYGLTASPTGDVLYTVEFLIQPRQTAGSSWFGSSKGRVTPGVATAYEGTARAGTVREWIVLDPSTFTSDLYDVEITVIDRVGEGSATRPITFAVQR